jgi:hypothetical protein
MGEPKTIMSNSNYKSISFNKLHKISIKNQEKFSRNVFTEKLIEDFPHLKTKILVVSNIMNIQEGGIRTIVHCGKDIPTLYQDFTKEQWNSLSTINI